MTYNDFSLDTIASVLGVSPGPADLFSNLDPVPVPAWLRDMLDRGLRQVLLSEKARSEFIVVPILLACQELSRRLFHGLHVTPPRTRLRASPVLLRAGP